MKRLTVFVLCLCLLCFPVRAAENEKLIALTFDDGPSGKYTRRLLDGLAKRDAKVTFFLCGYRIEQYPELTERIYQEGHEIGLHGYSHKSMDKMCYKETVREIEKTMALLPDGCGVSFLRAPGGLCGKCVQTAAADFGMSLLSWSVDPQDWATDDENAIVNNVLRFVRDGDVILMHDMSDSSVVAALTIIDKLQAQGYRFVTVSQLVQARDVALTPGTKYTRFYPAVAALSS